MRRRVLLAFVMCAALTGAGAPARGLGGPAVVPPAADAAAPGWLTLRNGARLLLVPDPRAAAVSVAVWVEAGVRYERPGLIGISHLMEHLSARGATPTGESEYRRAIEAEGGTSASFTTADFTCFTETVPRRALELGFRLEAGRFAIHPTQAMLDYDRQVVREENRARARTNPLELGIQRLYATTFPNHPYRWPALGSDDDLRRITVQDCEGYLRARYTPDHMFITVVGDFDPDQALEFARRHIERIGRRDVRREEPLVVEPEPTGERRSVGPGELQVPLLVVGWRVPSGATADAPALDVIAALLSGGLAGRLQRRLVAGEQTCLFARAGRDGQRDATMFWAAAALRSEGDTSSVERGLVGEIEKLAAQPVSSEELDRARRPLELALLLGGQSARDRGQALGIAQMVSGDWREANRHLERLRALTPEDLQRAAARTLTATRRTVVWLTPTAAPSGGPGGHP